MVTDALRDELQLDVLYSHYNTLMEMDYKIWRVNARPSAPVASVN